MTDRYDLAVVGGGIAGLAVAEIFARCGRSVVLLERNDRLCGEASGSQHGWFHMGSLYSIFPNNRFLRTMVGGVEDLIEFYSGFDAMNIGISEHGKLIFQKRQESWFRDEPIEYIVAARNDPDFRLDRFEGVSEYVRRIFFLMTWELAIKQFISRHRRFYRHVWNGPVPASRWIPRAGFADYSREVIKKPRLDDINLDPDTHFEIVGYDRPMRSSAMAIDLVRSLLGGGGVIRTGAEVRRCEQIGRGYRLLLASGESVQAQLVVCAAGQWIGRFLPRTVDLRIVASPLLVAYPAVTERNFVRMTPFVSRTINHLCHEVKGMKYSVIGGGYYVDPDDGEGIKRVKDELYAMAKLVFPKLQNAEVVESYMGYKTELVPERGERNYQYFIREVEKGFYIVVPGKFSLAFSLAVNTYKRLTGLIPKRDVRLASPHEAAGYVAVAKHADLVLRATQPLGSSAVRVGKLA